MQLVGSLIYQIYQVMQPVLIFKFGIIWENKTLVQGVSLQMNTSFLGQLRKMNNVEAYIWSHYQPRHGRTAKIVFQHEYIELDNHVTNNIVYVTWTDLVKRVAQ